MLGLLYKILEWQWAAQQINMYTKYTVKHLCYADESLSLETGVNEWNEESSLPKALCWSLRIISWNTEMSIFIFVFVFITFWLMFTLASIKCIFFQCTQYTFSKCMCYSIYILIYVCTCKLFYMYVHTHIHNCTCICIHTYFHMYMCTHIFFQMYVCTHNFTYTGCDG